MNTETSEPEFRRLFSELRDAEAQCAPSFNRVARGRPSAKSSGGRSLPLLRRALVMSSITLLAAGVARTASSLRQHRVNRELRQWAAISEWKAPTDALLGIAGAPWHGAPAAPSDSLINNSTTIE
jgi:hypothetical protein